MKSELRVLFYLKKNQTKKNGLSSVMGRIQIGKTMSQFSLKTEADANLWDTKAGRMTGKSKQALSINREIDRINRILHTRYKELTDIHADVSAHDIKNAMQGIASKQDTVLVHFRQMNETIVQRVGLDYSEAALTQYIYSYNALESYIRNKLKLTDIPFKALTYSFIEDYYQYLRIDKRFSVGTSGIYIVYFRKVVRNAVNQGILHREPFHGFEPDAKQTVHKSLTREELDKFMAAEPTVRQQIITKDLFIFATFTGLSYVDMKNLTYDKIKTMEDGSQWIIDKRHKTKVEYQVRLLAVPLAIIEKYKGQRSDGKVFTAPRNTTIHAGLNAMAKKCGISKKLGIHTARHTFASLITLSEGVPIETVSRMLGHEHITTTQIYAELSLDKLAEDMKALTVRIANQFTFIEAQ